MHYSRSIAVDLCVTTLVVVRLWMLFTDNSYENVAFSEGTLRDIMLAQ